MSSYVVTGGSNGIGLVAADAIKRMGHQALVIDIDCGVDVSNPAMVAGAFERIKEGGFDVVGALNCAAICGQNDGLVHVNPELFMRALEVNTLGVLLSMRQELGIMGGRGTIINVSSFPSFEVPDMPFAYGYVASKFAVSGISLMAAIEFHEARITAVCPTGIDTKLHADLLGKPAGESAVEVGEALAFALVRSALPTRRVIGQGELYEIVRELRRRE